MFPPPSHSSPPEACDASDASGDSEAPPSEESEAPTPRDPNKIYYYKPVRTSKFPERRTVFRVDYSESRREKEAKAAAAAAAAAALLPVPTVSPLAENRYKNVFWRFYVGDHASDSDEFWSQCNNGSKRLTPFHWYTGRGKKSVDDHDVFMEFMDYNLYLSKRGRCFDRAKGVRYPLSCHCLGWLNNGPGGIFYEAVANYQVSTARAGKVAQQVDMINRIKMAEVQKKYKINFYNAEAGRHSPKVYTVPFILPTGFLQELKKNPGMVNPYDEFENNPICKHALMDICGFGQHMWETCEFHARTNSQPCHLSKGKLPNNKVKWDSNFAAPLHRHFEYLIRNESGPLATRTVREQTGQQTMRDTNDKVVYLSPSLTKRKSYERFCYETGWMIRVNNQGALESKVERYPGVPSHELPVLGPCGLSFCPEIPSWTAYRTFWANHYPFLKVSRPSEDICGMCFQFHQAYKSRRSLTSFGARNLPMSQNDPGSNTPTPSPGGGSDTEEESGPPSKGAGDHQEEEGGDEEVNVSAEANAEQLERERIIVEASIHVRMASKQREVVNEKIDKARRDSERDVHHRDRTYTFICDYAQNMELPWFGENQPGETYYLSALSVFNFGVVNVAHRSADGSITDHLYAHIYKEGDGQKGGNNVASLLMKTLRNLNLLQENNKGKELNVIFDNCPGQNKNNFVLWLVPYLVEIGYFASVNFIFLVAGHTKNTADRLFNLLKAAYRRENVPTMDVLYELCNRSEKVTVLPVTQGDFRNYREYLETFYVKYKDLTRQHQFSSRMKPDGSIHTFTQMSAIEEHPPKKQNVQKKTPPGETFTRLEMMKEKPLRVIRFGQTPRKKRVELWKVFRKYISPEFQDQWPYTKPSDDLIREEQEDQKKRRQAKRENLKRKAALMEQWDEAPGECDYDGDCDGDEDIAGG